MENNHKPEAEAARFSAEKIEIHIPTKLVVGGGTGMAVVAFLISKWNDIAEAVAILLR